MKKNPAAAKRIIALAYFHRYGWMIAMLLFLLIAPKQFSYHIISIHFIVFSIWTWIGYQCKWRHIYCSYQNAYRRKMTPYTIYWQNVKKSDAYGVPLIFFLLGLALLLIKTV